MLALSPALILDPRQDLSRRRSGLTTSGLKLLRPTRPHLISPRLLVSPDRNVLTFKANVLKTIQTDWIST